MSLNTLACRVAFHDMPEFCGPRDLADAILDIRKQDKDGTDFYAPLSEGSIRRLIEMAYYTSLTTEEGRYPRFRLVSREHPKAAAGFAMSCEVPLANADTLRKLAPAVTDTDMALLIAEREGSLVCTGSFIMNDLGMASPLGHPGFVGVGSNPALVIRIDGPAQLKVSDGFGTLLLHRGRIREVVDYLGVPQVRNLWQTMAARWMERMIAAHGHEQAKFFGGAGTLAHSIHKIWSGMLADAIDRRHGGAFVILPRAGDTQRDFGITCKYPAQMEFGKDITDFWHTCVEYATAKDDQERKSAIHRWTWRRASMLTKAQSLAGLSAVDGCVVLDPDLTLLGFGGEIRIDESKEKTAPRALTCAKTGKLTAAEALPKLGTRHRSAYRLATVHPGLMAFVISQDGDLRLFVSDDNHVYGYEGLHAWVHAQDVT